MPFDIELMSNLSGEGVGCDSSTCVASSGPPPGNRERRLSKKSPTLVATFTVVF